MAKNKGNDNMNLEILRIKISRETDIETLRKMSHLLVSCIGPDKVGGGYVVVNDHNASSTMYTGSRENCIAFIEGYNAAPLTDEGCFDPSVNCVCMDTPSLVIVIPEERLGESLANNRTA